MKLYISEITESVTTKRVEFSLAERELGNGSMLKGIGMNLSFYRAGETVCLKFDGDFIVETICDRCTVDLELTTDVSESYYLFPKSSDNDVDYYYSGDFIELDDFISETVVMNMPNKILCSDDCKGLCENCGTNLNDNVCKCTKGE